MNDTSSLDSTGTWYDDRHEPGSRPVSVTHLVIGLVFLGIAGMWALAAAVGISGPDLTISGPVVLIVAGVVGLVVSLANARRRGRRRDDSPASYPSDPYQEQ